MPDDRTGPSETNRDQAKGAETSKTAPPNTGPGAEARPTDPDTLLAENAELRDRLLRSMADMENLRSRTEREKADMARYAISNFARDVLTIGDNLKRTVDHVPAEAAANDPALKSFLEGVELTERELLNVLERYGVKRIEPLGARFDPNSHQAMYEVQDASVPEGTVVEVMQAGYVIGDRCLRPALVAVAKGGEKPPKPQAKDAEAAHAQKAANDDFPGGGEPDQDERR